MRTLNAAFITAQISDSLVPLWRVRLTLDANDDTYDEDRLIQIQNHLEEAGHGSATLILDNSDATLSAKDYKGYQAVISYGMTTSSGDQYSLAAPMIVVGQQFHSSEGVLLCILTLQGLTDHIAEDHASGPYTIGRGDNRTIKTLITAVVDATLPPFSHTRAFTATFDSQDSLIDAFTPQDSLTIGVNDTRWDVINRLLGWTKNVMRTETDGAFHFLDPTVSGSTYDYEYRVNVANEHELFLKSTRTRLVMPNRIIVTSHPDSSTAFYGEAEYTDSSDITNMEKKEFHYLEATSNAQAALVAAAIMQNYRLQDQRGSADVPMNAGQEVHDFVLLTDSRQSDTRAGNIAAILRNAGDSKWDMRISFGGISQGGFLGLDVPRSRWVRKGFSQKALDFFARQENEELAEVLAEQESALAARVDQLANNDQFLRQAITNLSQQVSNAVLNAVVAQLHVTESLTIPVGVDKGI